MVDSISGNLSNPIQDSGLLGVGKQQEIEKTNLETAKDTTSVASLKEYDSATISDAAKQAYEKDKEILKFSRLAQRVRETVDADKVAQIKNMVDSGRINEYLRSLDMDDLVNQLLSSPASAFLK